MPSNQALQCLFCKHPNPAGSSFCNDCGSQLDLQPCEQCGAIDNRSAMHCHKCHTEFTLPVAPAFAPPATPKLRRGKLVALSALLLALIPLSLNFLNEPFPQLALKQPIPKNTPDVPLPAKAALALPIQSTPTIEVDPTKRLNTATPGDCPLAVATLGLCQPGT